MLTRKVFEAQAAIIKKHLPKVGREFSFEMASRGLHLRPMPVQYVDSDAMTS